MKTLTRCQKKLSMKKSRQILLFSQVFIMGTTKENEQVEDGVFNEMAPTFDQMVFERFFEVSR